jgi:hypothetical protein
VDVPFLLVVLAWVLAVWLFMILATTDVACRLEETGFWDCGLLFFFFIFFAVVFVSILLTFRCRMFPVVKSVLAEHVLGC